MNRYVYDNRRVPRRNVRHCLVTWKINNMYFARDSLLDGSISTCYFRAHEESELLWKIQLSQGFIIGSGFELTVQFCSEEKAKVPYFSDSEADEVLVETEEESEEDNTKKERIFANIALFVKSPSIDVDISDFFSGNIKENEPVDFKISMSYSDYAERWSEICTTNSSDVLWIFQIDIIYHEKEGMLGRYDIGPDRMRLAQIGIDLFNYACSSELCDITLKYETVELPAHKAILRGRSGKAFFDLSHKTIIGDPHKVIFYLLLFVYSGNLEILKDVGTLPNGLLEFAEDMGMHDLSKLINRSCLTLYGNFKHKSFNVRFRLPIHLLNRDEVAIAVKNKSFRINDAVFVMQFSVHNTTPAGVILDHFNLGILLVQSYEEVDFILDAIICSENGDIIVGSRRTLFSLEVGRKVEISEFASREFIAENFMDVQQNHFQIRIRVTFGKSKFVLSDKEACSTQLELDCSSPEPSTSTSHYRNSYRPDRMKFKKLSRDFGKLLHLNHYKDLNITCNSHEIKVHRIMLAARSQHFSNILDGLARGDSLKLDNVTYQNLKIILYEIYGGNGRVDNSNLLDELYKLSFLHGFLRLAHYCSIALEHKLNTKNCVRIFETAHLNGDDDMKAVILRKFRNRGNKIRVTPDWIRVSNDENQELANIFRSNLVPPP